MSKLIVKTKTQGTDSQTKWSRCFDKHQNDFPNFRELMAELFLEVSEQMKKSHPS